MEKERGLWNTGGLKRRMEKGEVTQGTVVVPVLSSLQLLWKEILVLNEMVSIAVLYGLYIALPIISSDRTGSAV